MLLGGRWKNKCLTEGLWDSVSDWWVRSLAEIQKKFDQRLFLDDDCSRAWFGASYIPFLMANFHSSLVPLSPLLSIRHVPRRISRMGNRWFSTGWLPELHHPVVLSILVDNRRGVYGSRPFARLFPFFWSLSIFVLTCPMQWNIISSVDLNSNDITRLETFPAQSVLLFSYS